MTTAAWIATTWAALIALATGAAYGTRAATRNAINACPRCNHPNREENPCTTP